MTQIMRPPSGVQEPVASWIRWFDQIGIEDIPTVGGKNASLGEMYRELAPRGVKVPNGFAVTADAYRHFLREAGLDRELAKILTGLDVRDVENLRRRGSQARDGGGSGTPVRGPGNTKLELAGRKAVIMVSVPLILL